MHDFFAEENFGDPTVLLSSGNLQDISYFGAFSLTFLQIRYFICVFVIFQRYLLSVLVDAADACNRLQFNLGPSASGVTRQWSIKVTAVLYNMNDCTLEKSVIIFTSNFWKTIELLVFSEVCKSY